MSDGPTSRVVQLQPRRRELEQDIRRIAEEDRQVFLSEHAKDRMAERGINRLDVIRVMRTAHIDGEIEAGRRAGEWKCKVVARIKGNREVGVITVVYNRQTIFVKTVEWEDL